MAAIGKLPVHIRLGDSDEVQIGVFELHVDGTGKVPTPNKTDMASMLRQAADRLDGQDSMTITAWVTEREKAVVDLVRQKAEHFAGPLTQLFKLADELTKQDADS